MIDIEIAKKEFNEYLKNFDLNVDSIKLKMVHTYEVMNYSRILSNRLNLSKEDSNLSELIALLHDIGRFEQSKLIDGIFDKADSLYFDHGKFGEKILFEDNMIRKFIRTNEYDEIIRKAILNHNKFAIENADTMSEKELLHAKLIRDNDKMDNFRVKLTENFKVLLGTDDINKIENDEISDNIYNDFMNHRLIVTTETKTILDRWISYIAFIFDMNFKESIKILQEDDMINKMFDRIEYKNEMTIEKMIKMKRESKKYVDSII